MVVTRVWLLALLVVSLLHARPANATVGTPREPQIYVLTFGPGDHPFSRFGHNAVAVVDPLTERGRVYNFGTFSFHSPTLISDFLKGRLRYWVSVTRLEQTLAAYENDNRSVIAQRLNLDASEKRLLLEKLRWSALPENKYYRYDYYLDNCSTRVRDLLDEVLNGALKKAARRPAAQTWRQHTSRLTQGSPAVYLGLNVALAGSVDRHNTRWEEMFLPEVLQAELRTLERGGKRFVSEERVLFAANREAPSPKAPEPARWLFVVGVALALIVHRLGRGLEKSRVLAYVWWVTVSLLGVLSAALGLVFWFFWLGTDHAFAHANENIFLFPVWMLSLPASAWALLSNRRWGREAFYWACLLAALSAVVGLLLKTSSAFGQDNWMFIALLLPIWIAHAVSAYELRQVPLSRNATQDRESQPSSSPSMARKATTVGTTMSSLSDRESAPVAIQQVNTVEMNNLE